MIMQGKDQLKAVFDKDQTLLFSFTLCSHRSFESSSGHKQAHCDERTNRQACKGSFKEVCNKRP